MTDATNAEYVAESVRTGKKYVDVDASTAHTGYVTVDTGRARYIVHSRNVRYLTPATRPSDDAGVVAQLRGYLERFGPGAMHSQRVMADAITEILDGARVAWAPTPQTPGRCATCGCDPAYPNGWHIVECLSGTPSPQSPDDGTVNASVENSFTDADDVREAVARAIRSVPIGPFGPNSLHMLNLGAQTHLNSTEALALADAALSATRPATVSAEAIYEAIAESHPDDRVDPLMESVYRIQANDVVKRLRAAGIEVTE